MEITMTSQSSRQQQLTVPSSGQMYAAVAGRDATRDGQFFYGVITTGVFCKPSCAARLANRENMRFFADTESATAAGFRPCKRCSPDNLQRDTENLVKIARYIEKHADDRLTLADLSKKSGLSPSRFQKVFKAAFGVSPKEYQDAARLGRLKDALKDGDDVTGAIFSAGFGSTSRVYGEAARNMGMTPASYRAGGKGETIYYACRNTELGPLMMAATQRGVCFAQFGDGPSPLLLQLQSEFPQARLQESPAKEGLQLDTWITALDDYLQQNAPRPDLPLDLRGTSFQLKVWRFLLSVKEGDVISYGELATGIGKPTSVRAAASACGANRVGVLVPCHRVLRGNGELGGYRWGVERKRTLLDLERDRQAQNR
jgi:AraC family transcriptional regulator of adaptative response/methylated-DNA-[protein]-cysteine methyltransferase